VHAWGAPGGVRFACAFIVRALPTHKSVISFSIASIISLVADKVVLSVTSPKNPGCNQARISPSITPHLIPQLSHLGPH